MNVHWKAALFFFVVIVAEPRGQIWNSYVVRICCDTGGSPQAGHRLDTGWTQASSVDSITCSAKLDYFKAGKKNLYAVETL